MIVLCKNLRGLADHLVQICTYLIENDFGPFYNSAEELYVSFQASLDHLKGKLGAARYDQLNDMLAQARQHFADGHANGGRSTPESHQQIKYGAWLMQDMEQVIDGKLPFAYPEAMYRWPRPSIN